MSNILTNIKHIYFTGIGGIGMSGIAEILLERGYSVSGSDRALSEITAYLETKGATIYQGHHAENLKDVDLLVYSSAIAPGNPERRQAQLLKIPEIRRAEMLALLMEGHYKIAIAGTHGKTTTTAIISHLIIEAGLDPTVVIGGKLKNLHTNAHLGKGIIFVAEADEYDRSFLTLSPDISVITSIDMDHSDIYQDMDDIRNSFKEFANLGSSKGKLICCEDDPQVTRISKHFKKEIITYGFSDAAVYQIREISFSNGGSNFKIYKENVRLAEVSLPLPGKHNALNALAGFIVAELQGINSEDIIAALYTFSGVDRRFEIKGTVQGITIVDDYAHHPTEVSATIESARSGWKKRVVVVFQPHLFSRTKDFYKEFAVALSKADLIILSEIYPAREEQIPGITSKLILEEASKQDNHNFIYIPRVEEIEEYLYTHLHEGDMLVTMGAGDIWRCGENLLNKLKVISI